MIKKYIITLERLQLVKEMIAQLDVYYFIKLRNFYDNYFKDHYKLIAIDLSKQQKLDTDPKATQHINFTKNIEKDTSIFFIIEEVKETILDISKRTVIMIYFILIKY